MPAAKLKRGDGTLDYRVLDQRAMELLLSAQGYTLEQAYQQARDEQGVVADRATTGEGD